MVALVRLAFPRLAALAALTLRLSTATRGVGRPGPGETACRGLRDRDQPRALPARQRLHAPFRESIEGQVMTPQLVQTLHLNSSAAKLTTDCSSMFHWS
jgi:hypothetical protein